GGATPRRCGGGGPGSGGARGRTAAGRPSRSPGGSTRPAPGPTTSTCARFRGGARRAAGGRGGCPAGGGGGRGSRGGGGRGGGGRAGDASGMRAVLLRAPGTSLEVVEVAEPRLSPEQVRVAVRACAVCRTDLHVVDGELPHPKLPLILGHQIVGKVIERGSAVTSLTVGDRVGIPWLAWADGTCSQCRAGRENLCFAGRFHGYTVDGGYAELAVADARFCFPLPEELDDVHAAPLLCAGMIGYRALRLAGQARRIGFYGFGSSAHLL